jgi:hypothetical protein
LTAPVCSTWVWMNRGTSQRTSDAPLGNTKISGVRLANLMVSRVILCLILVVCKGGWWVLEQPQGSLMERHPRFRWLCRVCNVYRVRMTMADYGGDSLKPSWLYTNCPFLQTIADFKCPSEEVPNRTLAVHYKNSAGKPCVRGGPDLKQSQAYPAGFGRALVRVFESHPDELSRLANLQESPRKPAVRVSDVFKRDGHAAPWPDAKLCQALASLFVSSPKD